MTQKIIKFDAPELDAIEKSKADQIRATFEPMGKMLSEFETAFGVIGHFKDRQPNNGRQ